MTISVIRNASMEDVVNCMAELAGQGAHSPEVRQLALEITQGAEGSIVAIHRWVYENVRYVPDPPVGNGELFTSAIRMTRDYRERKICAEDCDGHAIFCCALLGSLGYNARIALVDSNLDGEVDHAFAQVYSDVLADWINVDTTSNKPLGWIYTSGKEIYIEPK